MDVALWEGASPVDLGGWGGKKVATTVRCLSPQLLGAGLGVGEATRAMTSV